MLIDTMAMDYGRLPVDVQVAAFQAVLLRNQTLAEVLARAAVVGLPGWHVVAGGLCQTVWNVVTGQPPEPGILDYDLAYFDSSDLSWQAEDAVIQAGRALFGDLPAPVQIRNQARVHLWYEQKSRLPGQDRPVAPAMAVPDRAAVACCARRPCRLVKQLPPAVNPGRTPAGNTRFCRRSCGWAVHAAAGIEQWSWPGEPGLEP